MLLVNAVALLLEGLVGHRLLLELFQGSIELELRNKVANLVHLVVDLNEGQL